MRTTLFVLCIIYTTAFAYSQCEAANQDTMDPSVVADNSGIVQAMAALETNEYFELTGLLIGDNYEITSLNVFTASTTNAFVTIRSAVDNSVIASGFTPFDFDATTPVVTVHFFPDSSCDASSNFTLAIIYQQNRTTLSLGEVDWNGPSVYPSPFSTRLSIDANDIISKATIYNLSGQVVLELINCGRICELQTAALFPGLYFLQINTQDGRRFTQRIVKRN